MNKSILRTIKTFFSLRENIAAVYLYGSHAKGQETSRSDVDIALLFSGEAPGIEDRISMTEELSRASNRDVDLVFLNEVPSILRMQVIRHGELVVCNDQSAVTRFVVSTLQEYFDLKRVRRPIEEGLKKVTVHG